MGCPKQEKWIYMNYRELGVPVSIGIGASLDFIAGKFRRAPVWMRVCGLEWVVRLMQEPKRLFTRYCFDFLFFARVLAAPADPAAASAARRAAPLEPAGSPVGIPTIIYWHGRVDAAAVESGAVQAITPASRAARAGARLLGRRVHGQHRAGAFHPHLSPVQANGHGLRAAQSQRAGAAIAFAFENGPPHPRGGQRGGTTSPCSSATLPAMSSMPPSMPARKRSRSPCPAM